VWLQLAVAPLRLAEDFPDPLNEAGNPVGICWPADEIGRLAAPERQRWPYVVEQRGRQVTGRIGNENIGRRGQSTPMARAGV
jgi:hypothetical protein